MTGPAIVSGVPRDDARCLHRHPPQTPVSFYRHRRALLVVIGSLFAALAVAAVAASSRLLLTWDEPITRWLVAHRTPALDTFFLMREELETRHEKMPPGSQLVVDATARVHGPREIAQPLARGLVSSCLVEAEARARLASFEWGEHNRFEDLRVPRLLVSVDDMRTEMHAAA